MIDFNIRKADIKDAPALTEFVIQLDNESKYLLFGPGERHIDINSTLNYIQKINNNVCSFINIAEDKNKKIIGFLCGEASGLQRISHILKINIGVLKNARGTRVARELAITSLENAKRSGVLRIEATIIKENKLSLNMCRKFGFEVEGLKKSSIKIGNKFYDEFLLGKLLF